ncbi:MAG: lamin tail domain-containing protein, partial [Candidatus Limnocylindrales bacterium]
MLRARRAGPVALPLSLVLVLVVASVAMAAHRPAFRAATGSPSPVVVAVAAVQWPVSTLVISEVETGGASASDEFAELANAGSTAVDLIGLEVVYVTSTGSTVTRKASWAASRVLDPGRHLLIANTAGIHAGAADATYSGGFAAAGGSLVLRPIGGTPIDAVGWGDATNTFVEGVVAPAPAAGSSIERRPGGAGGNGIDTNDNVADFAAAVPNPQNVSMPPAPDPSASPSPTIAPTPSPTIAPVVSIIDARALPDGSTVRIAGTLTTDLGAIDSARIGFVQDGTDGIAVRLDAALGAAIPAGSSIVVDGTLGSYFSLRVVSAPEAAIQILGSAALPEPVGSSTGGADEAFEGLRLSVDGIVTEAPSVLADGLGVTVDDGSGSLRVVVSSAARADTPIATGDHVIAVGPLGQRDSSGTGLSGYRLHATLPGELMVVAPPTPTPSPSAPPSPTSTPSSTPVPTPTTTPSPTPSPSPTAMPSPTPSSTPVPRPTSSPSPSPSPTVA